MAKNNPYQPKINTGLSLKKGQSFGTNKMNIKGTYPSFSTPKTVAPSYTAPKTKVTIPNSVANSTPKMAVKPMTQAQIDARKRSTVSNAATKTFSNYSK